MKRKSEGTGFWGLLVFQNIWCWLYSTVLVVVMTAWCMRCGEGVAVHDFNHKRFLYYSHHNRGASLPELCVLTHMM
jgi:hypothetical protein